MGFPFQASAVVLRRMSLLICFSGKIGSGKSAVSRAVAQVLRCEHCSFGDYLRDAIGWSGGDPTCRKTLQDLGEKLVRKNPESFCRAVLATGGFTPKNDFVLDGLRHAIILQILRRVARPSTVRLIFLDVSKEARDARIKGREDSKDLDRASAHCVESELQESLPTYADIVVNADQPFEDVVTHCLEAIESWR